MFFDSISLIAAAGAIFILRKRAKKNETDESGIFKLKLYPWLPGIYILIYTLINMDQIYINTLLKQNQTEGNGWVGK